MKNWLWRCFILEDSSAFLSREDLLPVWKRLNKIFSLQEMDLLSISCLSFAVAFHWVEVPEGVGPEIRQF